MSFPLHLVVDHLCDFKLMRKPTRCTDKVEGKMKKHHETAEHATEWKFLIIIYHLTQYSEGILVTDKVQP